MEQFGVEPALTSDQWIASELQSHFVLTVTSEATNHPHHQLRASKYTHPPQACTHLGQLVDSISHVPTSEKYVEHSEKLPCPGSVKRNVIKVCDVEGCLILRWHDVSVSHCNNNVIVWAVMWVTWEGGRHVPVVIVTQAQYVESIPLQFSIYGEHGET